MQNFRIETANTFNTVYKYFLSKEKYLFLSIIVIYLVPIWYIEYFITGDGPCHLYNSKILLDLLKQNNTEFYSTYYEINTYPEPNWFSHFSLLILLNFFSPFIAEKLFLSAFVIVFIVSLRALIKSINEEGLPLMYLAIPFVFNGTFQMGFYNYSFSFPLMFFTIHFYLTHKSSLNKWNIVKLMLLLIVTFFTHPIGYGLACIVISGILFIDSFNNTIKINITFFKTLYKNSIPVFISALPTIILTLYYLSRKGINASPSPDSLERLTSEFFHLSSVVALNSNEHIYTFIYSVTLWSTAAFTFLYKLIKRQFSKNDIWFFYFAAAVVLYFKQPGGAAGAGIVSIRIQIIPYVFMVFWITSVTLPKVFKLILSTFLIGLSITFILIRMPYYKKISDGVKEHLSISQYIDDHSTVAPLTFNMNGVDKNQNNIVDRIWLFNHTFDYIGTEKSLILFDNYEANTGYFPLIWKKYKNPYFTLYPHPEALPPDINLDKFIINNSGASVDYVLVYALNESLEDHPYVVKLIEQLEGKYSFVGQSNNGFIKVFKANNKIKNPVIASIKKTLFNANYEMLKSYTVIDSINNNTIPFHEEYSPTFVANMDTLPCDKEHWIKINCKIKSNQEVKTAPSIVISCENENGIFNYKFIQLSDIGKNWQNYYLKSNLKTEQKGIISAYIWNSNKEDLSIENFEVQLLKTK